LSLPGLEYQNTQAIASPLYRPNNLGSSYIVIKTSYVAMGYKEHPFYSGLQKLPHSVNHGFFFNLAMEGLSTLLLPGTTHTSQLPSV
jgi:hypothetical protein